MGSWWWDQLHQRHVARRVEEVDAAKRGLIASGSTSRRLVIDRPEVLDGHDGVLGDERGDLGVEVQLPVHALGNGLDHQVALFQQFRCSS